MLQDRLKSLLGLHVQDKLDHLDLNSIDNYWISEWTLRLNAFLWHLLRPMESVGLQLLEDVI